MSGIRCVDGLGGIVDCLEKKKNYEQAFDLSFKNINSGPKCLKKGSDCTIKVWSECRNSMEPKI